VADAVAIEPVSASKFPAIREINREFLRFQKLQGYFLLKMTNNHSHLRGIFPLRQTGNFSVASGKHFLETGAFLTLEVLFREFTKLVGNGTKKP